MLRDAVGALVKGHLQGLIDQFTTISPDWRSRSGRCRCLGATSGVKRSASPRAAPLPNPRGRLGLVVPCPRERPTDRRGAGLRCSANVAVRHRDRGVTVPHT
jgi:hypothetical protein